MRRFFLLLILLFVFLAISASFYFKRIAAEDVAVSAQTEISVKLDKILENQTEILHQLESLSKDVKARCTK